MALSRKKLRKLDELPGLWDTIPETDPMAEALDKLRKKQYSPERPLNENDLERQMLQYTPRRSELEFISFGSGSSGNCAYIGIRGMGGVLIDAGVDFKQVIAELERNYIPIDRIDGIIITHDHSDHVRFAYSLIRKLTKANVYCTPRTLTGMLRRHSLSNRIKDYHKPIFKEFEFEAGPFTITPFEVSHDGSDNVGFCIKAGEKHFVVATDTGKITERADHYIRMANFLMIETDYDEDMLEKSNYPSYLKDRIRRERGHLSNDTTARYLHEIWDEKLTDIFLCHLSDNNNTPQLALDTVREMLLKREITVGDASCSSEALKADVQLTALPRESSSPHFILTIS